MPIEFACPSCQRPYRVKEALAGKTAKCGQCGNRMQIPHSTSGAPVTAISAPPKPAAPKPTAAKTAAPQPIAALAVEPDLGAWMADELAAAPLPAAKSAPQQVTCPKCAASQPPGALLCGTCGHDIRGVTPTAVKPLAVKSTGGKSAAAKKPSRKIKFDFKLGSKATLIRGTFLSVVFAMIGSVIWAGVAVLTMREFGIIAWAMGGLAGFGMALGHEDDDGTTAGILAAFVSLFGILAAKVLIVVFVVAALAAAVVGGMDDILPIEAKRQLVANEIATEAINNHGGNPANISTEQWKKAIDKAQAEVEGWTDEQVEQRWNEANENMQQQFDKAKAEAELAAANQAAPNENQPVEAAAAEGNEAAKDEPADGEQPEPAGQPPAPRPGEAPIPAVDEGPGFVAFVFQNMFNPIDGLWMLLAFFTAYKVGSGKQTD